MSKISIKLEREELLMDRLLIITCILIGTIILSIASLFHLKDTSQQFFVLIEKAEESCLNHDIINLQKYSNALSDLLNDRHSILSLYVSHEEIEKIESNIIILQSYVITQTFDGALASLKQLHFTTNHMYERELLNFNNIF